MTNRSATGHSTTAPEQTGGPGAELAGQVALVTGASRGLGLLIARELARKGATVTICARDAGELERAGADLRRGGGRVEAFVCDVTQQDAVQAMVAHIAAEVGPVDLLFNVAGIIEVGPLTSMTRADFERSMDTMFWGPVNLTDAVLPSMRARRRGRIATVTSIGGKVSVPHLLPYSSAKFAAVGYFEGLRAELAGTGVTATTVVPGLMRTGSHVNATFTGQQGREYTWFSLGASLPLVSMDAERAARRIVAGVLRGRREILLSPMTKIATRVHGLAPSTTIALMGVMARVLPQDTDRRPARPNLRLVSGKTADAQVDSTLLRKATVLGRKAAARFNE